MVTANGEVVTPDVTIVRVSIARVKADRRDHQTPLRAHGARLVTPIVALTIGDASAAVGELAVALAGRDRPPRTSMLAARP